MKMARLTLAEQLNTLQEKLDSVQAEHQQLNMHYAAMLEQNRQDAMAKRDLQIRIDLMTTTVADFEKLKKELDSSKSSNNYSNTRAEKVESELEQAHAVLDGVDGAPAREYEMEYGKGRRNIVTRLAGAFLAIAKNGGVK
jgi:chromosome segregation ATPase